MITERDLLAFLTKRYVQHADNRQRMMGLQYMTAETHDLARTIAAFLVSKGAAAVHPQQGASEFNSSMVAARLEQPTCCANPMCGVFLNAYETKCWNCNLPTVGSF